MQIQISKQINGIEYKFNINEAKDIDALGVAGVFASMPIECKLCNSDKIHLSSNRAKGYLFVKMICEECNGRSQVGQYKDTGLFWKEWAKYEAPTEQGVPTVNEETPNDPFNQQQ